jgi:hypothetical protein
MIACGFRIGIFEQGYFMKLLLRYGRLTFRVSCAVVSSLWFLSGCQYSETFSDTSQTFTLAKGNEPLFGYKDRYFLLVKGDTALFYGLEACTVITNGKIVSADVDTSYFRTITLPSLAIPVNDSAVYLIPQIYQQGSSLLASPQYSVIRYFRKTTPGILQIAYFQNNVMTYLKKEMQGVIPTFIEVGSFDTVNSPNNHWASPLLIVNPIPFTNGRIWISGHSVGTRAIAQENMAPFFLNGITYFTGIEVKSYYAFNGYASENDAAFRFLGTLEVTRKYFKNIGMVDEKIQLLFQKTFDNGTVQLTKKTLFHERGPEGAKIYPDDIPD